MIFFLWGEGGGWGCIISFNNTIIHVPCCILLWEKNACFAILYCFGATDSLCEKVVKYFVGSSSKTYILSGIKLRNNEQKCFFLCIQISVFDRGVYFSDPPKKTCWGKKWLEGDEKGGGAMYIFSPLGKKYAYFFPNWLKIYKIAKKGLNIFRPRSVTPHYNKFHLG